MKKIFEKKNLIIGLIIVAVLAIGFYFWTGRNGRFVRTGDMTIARIDHAATLLQDGRVLITGGSTDEIYPQTIDNSYLASAEIYNPATGKFTKTSDMTEKRSNHVATLLKDGRVLITGGNIFSAYYLASAEIYDPKTNKFTKTGDMNLGRFGHSAILLNNGKVLIMGGGFSLKPPKKNPLIMSPEAKKYRFYGELYDPATGKFTFTGKSKGWYAHPTLALMQDGKVLVVGDYRGKVAEIYDPIRNEFTQIDYNPVSASNPNDKIIFIGFREGVYPRLYNVNIGKFIKSKSKLDGHAGTTTLLNNNKVLIVGVAVYNKDGYLTDDFNTLYDVKNDTFTIIGKTKYILGHHAAIKLNNGDVLVTGGSGKKWKNQPYNKILKEAVLYKY